MAENKTKPGPESVTEFLGALTDETLRKDCQEIVRMMQEITGEKPVMWAGTMVGFGTYHYKYASGREGDAFLTGFSPRKQNLTLYVICDHKRMPELLAKLGGKFKTSKACLYIKKLDDIDRSALRELIDFSYNYMKNYEWS
jgi:hypothetical protein